MRSSTSSCSRFMLARIANESQRCRGASPIKSFFDFSTSHRSSRSFTDPGNRQLIDTIAMSSWFFSFDKMESTLAGSWDSSNISLTARAEGALNKKLGCNFLSRFLSSQLWSSMSCIEFSIDSQTTSIGFSYFAFQLFEPKISVTLSTMSSKRLAERETETSFTDPISFNQE